MTAQITQLTATFTLADLILALTGQRVLAPQQITHAKMNSRDIEPGGLFVAMPGESANGHAYLPDAFARGAVFALIEQDVDPAFTILDLRTPLAETDLSSLETPVYLRVANSLEALQEIARHWMKTLALPVVGITGSVGKSSTKELAAVVLGERFATYKNPGNFNSEIGLPLSVIGISPDHERVVLEMGFYLPGEIAFLCDIAHPKYGIVTNIGQVHAERAGSQTEIARGKAELVQNLPPDGWAILNYDDPLVREMAAQTPAQVLTYGFSPGADLWADDFEGRGLDGIRFTLHYQGETHAIASPLLGRHSVYTILGVVAVALLEGLTWDEINAGLSVPEAQLRMRTVHAYSGALLLDDTYNASPQSTLAALDILADLDGQKIAVLGDMLELGPYEQEGHHRVGLRVASVADRVITIGERARTIAAAAREAGMPSEKIIETASKDEALELLLGHIHAGDVVLVKGSRGMHMDKIVPQLEAAE